MTRSWYELRDTIFDSRDIIERIDELEGIVEDDEHPESRDEAKDELAILAALRDEADGYVSDWQYGETFIPEDMFEDYAQELAEDTGAIDPQASWPLSYIDWTAAANALKDDYTSFEVDGRTYWAR